MIVDVRDLPGPPEPADVVVVGAGPAGIVLALELARAGVRVTVVESGDRAFNRAAQQLSDAGDLDPDIHAPMSLAVRRQVGGTSVIWGGRCVPYDPVDFDERPYFGDHAWPVTYDEIVAYYGRACEWMQCGRAVFDAHQIPGLPRYLVPGLEDGQVRTSSLERWSLPTNFGREYRREMERSLRAEIITGLTCTRVQTTPDGRSVDHLVCRSLAGETVKITGGRYVIASGGLESTRLLLASPRPDGVALGNHSDQLGRWYMGHAEGSIANVRFSTPPERTIFGYERDIDGVWVRRRFSLTREAQHEHQLPNVVGWLANQELADPAHGSGILSFVYIALSSPLGRLFTPDAQRLSLTGRAVTGSPYGQVERGPIREHLRNIMRDRRATARFVVGFGTGRFMGRRRLPGFFVYSRNNLYPLQYHAEHLPNRESRVTLSDKVDGLGMPRLRIDLRFSDEDAKAVVRTHELWDDHLQRCGVGRLEYAHEDRVAAVRRRLGGGFHQVGTTRMSAAPADGVLDANLAVHGVDNLYVLSSSAFVTSSQANSTLLIIAFAVRLADHLRRLDGPRD